MTITEKSRDFTAAELYKMTKSASIITVKSVEDGTALQVNGWVTFDDEDSKGEISHMLSISGTDAFGDNVVWSCQSQTFKDNFFDIYSLFDGEPFAITKISGLTKAGREYVNCDLA